MSLSALKWEVTTARTKAVLVPWHVLGQILSRTCFPQQEKFSTAPCLVCTDEA